MKISKLFHWLYAILMLLPCFFIGGRVLYTIFNKNAKDSYSGANSNEYTEVSPTTFVNGQKYTLNILTDSLVSQETVINLYGHLDIINGVSSGSINTIEEDCTTFRIINNGSTNAYVSFRDSLNTTLGNINIKTTNLIFTFVADTSTGDLNYLLPYLSYKIFNDNYNLDNAFSYSMEQINDNRLFSWASHSFLNEPFQYITGLFGIEADNPINTLLSYWLSISLIWLVFDIVIYVPLLVHRWIDKGVLE